MEKKEVNKETFNRPDGVEVKLTAKSINIKGFLFFFILFLTGSYLFVYVWDEYSSFNAGLLLGTTIKGIISPKSLICILLLVTFYTLLQAGVLYWFSSPALAFRLDKRRVYPNPSNPIEILSGILIIARHLIGNNACNSWILHRRGQYILFRIIGNFGWYRRFSFLVQPSCL